MNSKRVPKIGAGCSSRTRLYRLNRWMNESLKIHVILVANPSGRGKTRTTRTFNLQRLLASKQIFVCEY